MIRFAAHHGIDFWNFLSHDVWHPLKGWGYQFWSGVGSDLTEIVIVGWLYAFLRKHNCHTRRCWRIGRHPIEGTPYIVCSRHHPQVPNRGPTAEDIQNTPS